MSCLVIFAIAGRDMGSYRAFDAPVAQLDRALPSEGRGHRFESCRVHHFTDTPTSRVFAQQRLRRLRRRLGERGFAPLALPPGYLLKEEGA